MNYISQLFGMISKIREEKDLKEVIMKIRKKKGERDKLLLELFNLIVFRMKISCHIV